MECFTRSPARTIPQLLSLQAESIPDAIALAAHPPGALGYRELLGQVEAVAASLAAIGIGRHDRIAVVLSNGLEMAVAFLAVCSRAVCAPLNPAGHESEFEFYLSDLNAKALIVQSGKDSPAVSVARKLGIPVLDLTLPFDRGARLSTSRGQEKSPSVGGSVAPDELALVLYTSGTTSKPKRVPLTHGNLCASADNIKSSLRLARGDRCLNFMPLFHIHGLVGGLLSSLAAGASVALPGRFDADHVFEWMEELGPTWYTAVPTIHQAIVREARSRSCDRRSWPLRFIRSSSAPLPPRLLADLKEVFKVPVIEAYGMTEAAHQITSNPLPPGERKSGSVGLPTGSQVEIMDEAGNLLPRGKIGEIVIRGANITRGYEDNAAANEAAFIHGWFRTGDQGYLDRDGYLFITGRIKELINRGGEKISPQEIEAVLLDHPAISEVAVFPLAHSSLGEEVAAAVLAKPAASITERELQEFVLRKLPEFKIPRRIVFLEKIPRGPTGKVQRKKLAQQLVFKTVGEDNQSGTAFVAPRTAVETALAEIWRKVLRVERIGIFDSFFDLGADSITCAQVINRISSIFAAELSFQDFFESPTVVTLAATIETKVQAQNISAPISTSRPNKLPLSFAQQRIWFFSQLDPGNAVYNSPLALRLRGQLNVKVLEECLNEIVRRHEALRTLFLADEGEPEQRVAPRLTIELAVTDFGEIPESKRQAQALGRAVELSQEPFDLANGPLLRTHLFRLSEDDHLLLLVTHHLVFDGWSDTVLRSELTALYGAFIQSAPSLLPEPSLQYADYTLWQRKQFGERDWEKDFFYWKKQLEDAPLLSLYTDRPRPAAQSFRGARKSFGLPVSLTAKLTELSRPESATLFMTLLAACKILLFRYSGQDDILVGVPTAGRRPVETERLIGVFINTLVLRTRLSGNPSFRDLLRRVRETALGAYAHQDLSFEKLVEALHPDRDLSHSPFFQVMFVLRNLPDEPATMPGLRLESMELDIGVARFDLTIEIIQQRDHGLMCRFEYNTDLFDDATIERMGGHFRTLLEGIAADPESRISELPLITETERHEIVVEWNDTRQKYPADKCIAEVFEAQVEKTPDATAVVFADRRLSYRELNRQANQLARYLQRLGIGPEKPVAICVERSLEMVVGLLAILKAGGAYVPLDPCYPKERLAFMLKDALAPVLLTQKGILASFPEHEVRVVCLDADREAINRENDGNTHSGAAAENLAYVMYTSGSTGTPKGVEISHRGITRLLFGVDYVELDASQTFLQLAPISFDASTFEIWGALLHGGKCVLSPQRLPGPAELRTILERHEVTTLWLTASLFNTIVDEDPLTLAGVRQLLIGGEALSVSHVRRALSMLPATQIINGYGPTESTTFTCCYRIPHELGETTSSIPIGRPIGNTTVYLLDPHLTPVPIGAAGQLYIGGDGLARGYLNRPDLTRENFIANPFSSVRGARLYKTGDRARYLPDGNIEFLGRIDDQVKIRGFRIEPGEIEAALNRHCAVRESVVVARRDERGDKRLVAYITTKDKTVPAAGELKYFLAQKLPDHMIPSAFVTLGELPLTANGKVDRSALPDPHENLSETVFVAPRTPFEETLAKVWARVLRLDRVGVHDNFFELGGHSLLAVRLAREIEIALNKTLPPAMLFQFPTVEQVAGAVGERNLPALSPLVPVRSTGSKPPLFFVHGDYGYGHFPTYLKRDRPFYGLAQHLEGRVLRHTSVEQIAAYYVSKVRTVQPAGPYFIGGHSVGALIAFEMAQQLRRDGEPIAMLVLLEAATKEQEAAADAASVGSKRRDSALAVSRAAPKAKLMYFSSWLKKQLRMGMCEIYHVLNRPLPPKLQKFYLRKIVFAKIYREAARDYRPKAYPGHIVYFKARAATRDSAERWRSLAQGGLEVHEVSGGHATMLRDPHAKELAGELAACIRKAEAGNDVARNGGHAGVKFKRGHRDETISTILGQ